MTEALLELPADLARRLERNLEAGLLSPPYEEAAVRHALGVAEGAEAIAAGLAVLEKMGITGPAAAAWLRTVRQVKERTRRPDVVWSGHEVPGVAARKTKRVYEELLGSAERSVWVSTYVVQEGGLGALNILAQRMDELPELRATLLLNIQRKYGDTTAADALVAEFAEKFWSEWPAKRRPAVYYDPRSVELGGPGGVLHAKAVVVDGERLFVTSANLTEAALGKNVELGLLVRDRVLAGSVVRHFEGLVGGELVGLA